MGWNSWDSYGLTITEPQFRANVDVLKHKLLPFGWNYAVIDEGWFFANPNDRPTPDKLHYAIDRLRPLRSCARALPLGSDPPSAPRACRKPHHGGPQDVRQPLKTPASPRSAAGCMRRV